MVFLKRYWFFLLLILGVFFIQIIFYSHTFNEGVNLLFWQDLDKKDFTASEDDDLEGKWGAFGDYIGGVLNPILGFVTIVLLLISHYRDGQRESEYQKQREVDLLLIRIHKLIDNHNNNIENFEIFNKSIEVVHSGRFVFTRIFNMMRIVNSDLKFLSEKGLTSKDIVKISYILIYFGNHNRFIKFLNDNYPTINYESDLKKKIDEINETLTSKFNLRVFNGFNTIFGTYFRSIYHIIDSVNSSDKISAQFKYELVKDIRSQMSNQEQALLLINSMTNRGRKWIDKELLIKYKICRNIDREIDLNGYRLEQYIYEIIDRSKYTNEIKKEIKEKYFEY